MKQSYVIESLADWQPCLRALEAILRPGMIVALSGPLGAGKTTFVQEAVRHFGGSTLAKSPTFALVRTYRMNHASIQTMLHVDAYRLEREEDAQILDLDEALSESGTVLFLEWPEHLPLWLVERADRVIWLTIHPVSETHREAKLEWRSES